MYIELHARSAFSFLEGASVPEELAEVCAAHQMPAMALLDRDGVYGAPRFHLAMKKLNLQAHIGAEITFLLPSTDPVPPDLALPAPAAAVRLARRLPEPLPSGDAHEVACAKEPGITAAPRESLTTAYRSRIRKPRPRSPISASMLPG